jgi:hypothetical protein
MIEFLRNLPFLKNWSKGILTKFQSAFTEVKCIRNQVLA